MSREEWRSARREAGYETRRWIWWLAGMALFVGVIGFGLSTCGSALNIASQPAKIAEKTFAADNVIQNYEWFRQQYRDILAFDGQIEQAGIARERFLHEAGPRSGWHMEDRQRAAELDARLTGLQAQQTRMIETYNARASMHNRALFRGRDVPAQIEPRNYQQQ